MLFQTDFSCGNEAYPLPSEELPESFWVVCASEPSVDPRWRLACVYQVSINTPIFSLLFSHLIHPTFGTTKRSWAQTMFAINVFEGVLGLPCLARHTPWFSWFSVVPEATYQASQGPQRALCQLQKPFKFPRQRRGSCWKDWKRKYLSVNRIFFLSGPFKICLLKLVSLN